MFALLNQRRLGWLGHVKRMTDEQIPKEILYSNLTSGTRPVGRPSLRFKVEGRQYQPYTLGSYSCRPKSLEACWKDRRVRRAEKSSGKGGQSTHRAKYGVHLQQLQQNLPIQNRTGQPQQALQLNPWLNFGADSIVSRDRRMQTTI